MLIPIRISGIERQITVLKVLGLNPNGITLENPQETECQSLADFYYCTYMVVFTGKLEFV